ncbi:hypothetical protein GLOIN_2v1553558 [Rhizophagus clarus]|uniref:Uncharacterized protein n=1 Tax=Rhizophagus clarus TaxID=94130 RepID=A0A8H3QT68_9GLOM|nr:hypothetical protein GLOIN_2v1553558 [Rhizophagus clarus]
MKCSLLRQTLFHISARLERTNNLFIYKEKITYNNIYHTLRALKQAYDEGLMTKDEYDEFRLKELNNWGENQEEKKSFWGELWNKACKFGSYALRNRLEGNVSILETTTFQISSIIMIKKDFFSFQLLSPTGKYLVKFD